MSDSDNERYSGKAGRFSTQRGDVRRVNLSIPDSVAEKLDEMLIESGINYGDAHYSELTWQNSELAEYILDVLKNHVDENGSDENE